MAGVTDGIRQVLATWRSLEVSVELTLTKKCRPSKTTFTGRAGIVSVAECKFSKAKDLAFTTGRITLGLVALIGGLFAGLGRSAGADPERALIVRGAEVAVVAFGAIIVVRIVAHSRVGVAGSGDMATRYVVTDLLCAAADSVRAPIVLRAREVVVAYLGIG
jgi:hypothetical protein